MRIFITILLFLVITFLGFFRDKYLINFFDRERPVIMERYEANRIYGNLQSADKEITFVQRTPKWISAVIFSLIYAGIGTGIIHYYFRNRKFTVYTLWIYVGVMVLTGLLLGISLVSGAFGFGYLAMQPLKNLVQSPLMVLVLFVYFMVMGGKS